MNWFEQLESWSFTASDGITLRGWQTALTGKPIIYFRHGNGFCCLTYQPMLESLAKHFDLIMMDSQGHGESLSDRLINHWQPCALHAVEHISATRSQWGGVPLFGVGHSFGAVLTLIAMGKQPDIFDRCVLLDPVIFPQSWQPLARIAQLLKLDRHNPMAKQALSRRTQWPSRNSAYRYLLGRGTFKGWDDRALRAYVNHALAEDEHGIRLKCAPETEASVFSARTGPLWSIINRIEVPLSIIVGEKSYPFAINSAVKANKRNKIIQYNIVDGGHCFMQQFPDKSAQLIFDKLKQD